MLNKMTIIKASNMIDSEIFMRAVEDSRDGITISDPSLPDNPLIYVNDAFSEMTGYSKEEAINFNCRYLQGQDKNQRNITTIRNAISKGEYCLVTLRNYRKDGSMFWNELSISPVFNADEKLTHFIGIQKDVSARVILEQKLANDRKALQQSKNSLEHLVIHDSLTGIYNRRYFESELDEKWNCLTKSKGSLTLMMIDVDYFKRYNDTYGHVAGDEILKKVATSLTSAMRRITDFTARYGGEEFIVLAVEMTAEESINYARILCAKIRSLNIPHEGSPHKFLTVSCGVARMHPLANDHSKVLIKQADTALYSAKANGRNQAQIYSASLQPNS